MYESIMWKYMSEEKALLTNLLNNNEVNDNQEDKTPRSGQFLGVRLFFACKIYQKTLAN